jgi:hypothetical protein
VLLHQLERFVDPVSVIMIVFRCLTFESGCRIGNVGDFSFGGCLSQKSICLPARLRQVTGLAMDGSRLRTVVVDTGNCFFGMSVDFTVEFEEAALVRYSGMIPKSLL